MHGSSSVSGFLRVLNKPHLARCGALVAMVLAMGLTLAGCTPQVVPASQGFTLLDGKQQTFEALRGKPLLVNFWATTCAICVREMPQVAELHQRFASKGLQTLAVAMNYDPPARVAQFAQDWKLPFGVVIDNTGAVEKAFGGVSGTPTFFLVSPNGVVLQRIEGQPDFSALALRIERMLGS
jgi:thiol-disulfide isomerase/thioredoxin